MKKIIKIFFHLGSVLGLAMVVFAGSLLVKVTSKDTSKEAKGGVRDTLPSLGFGTNHALADLPAGDSGTPLDTSDCEGGGGGGGGGC